MSYIIRQYRSSSITDPASILGQCGENAKGLKISAEKTCLMYSVTQGVKTYPCPFIKFFQCILVQVTDTQTAHISTVHQNFHFLYNDYD